MKKFPGTGYRITQNETATSLLVITFKFHQSLTAGNTAEKTDLFLKISNKFCAPTRIILSFLNLFIFYIAN